MEKPDRLTRALYINYALHGGAARLALSSKAGALRAQRPSAAASRAAGITVQMSA